MSYIKAEYLWLDGTKPTALIRSKTKILKDPKTPIVDLKTYSVPTGTQQSWLSIFKELDCDEWFAKFIQHPNIIRYLTGRCFEPIFQHFKDWLHIAKSQDFDSEEEKTKRIETKIIEMLPVASESAHLYYSYLSNYYGELFHLGQFWRYFRRKILHTTKFYSNKEELSEILKAVIPMCAIPPEDLQLDLDKETRDKEKTTVEYEEK